MLHVLLPAHSPESDTRHHNQGIILVEALRVAHNRCVGHISHVGLNHELGRAPQGGVVLLHQLLNHQRGVAAELIGVLLIRHLGAGVARLRVRVGSICDTALQCVAWWGHI